MRLSRRRFTTATSLLLAAPFVVPGLAAAQTQATEIAEAARAFPRLHSVLVQRGGEVVLAKSYRGPGLDRPANIKSCSKSIVALLLGIAIDRGEIPGVHAPLSEIAPDLVPRDATPGAGSITVQDLVTMRAGLGATSGPEYGAWVASENWVAYALRRPMVGAPGGRMIYSTGSSHVLGAALAKAVGDSLLTQARHRLGDPLGIDIPAWTRDPQGYYLGGNQMALTPRAMLRLALLMRDGGRVDGTQVVSQDWVEASAQPRTVSPWSGLGYGYGWFLSDSGYRIARGYGGQVIAANPARDLAVAITSDPGEPARSQGYFGELMEFLDGPVLQA
ncbi:serine hydrolase [Thalassobaculum sp. OXR-137]|uniref:serine hydrolase domain-containing protein n=1 Tax=Thalassobaculum sp. OXR-137 TaxID=3100173 RepID=UPI002AC8E396|nr:serine hydrolase [Thalassobaculum sp. OXR-137]WPZ32388.1 serine hydrolase [Thalassobaculum sp. OXR-137]